MPEELETTWRQIRAELRASAAEAAFDTWLAPLAPVDDREGVLTVSAPAETLRWVEARYLHLLRQSARRATGRALAVELVDEGALAAEEGEAQADGACVQPRPDTGDRALNPRYTFDGFVICVGNRLAHAASLAVAEQPAQAYNPLFLFGPPGLGKTHLLHAIGHYVRAYAGEMRVAYTTVEAFTGEFVAATRRGDFKRFHERFRDVDVLLVDDVQFLAHRAGTMEAFFHTFNALYESGRQMVLTSDRPPGELGGLEDRLRERFHCGLVAALEPPDMAARTTILRKRAHADGVEGIDAATFAEVARVAPPTVRGLEGALIRLVAYSSLTGEQATPELARKVLGGLLAEATRANAPLPKVEEIKHATADAFGLDVEALDGEGRSARVAFARQVGMYLTRELARESLPAVGAAFGGRRHATVAHACRRVEREVAANHDARRLVDNLKASLAARP
ncbi:MAG TPA: chromosomal replication initiator protein DnaA [Thermoleophilaceae bacterium]|nr:chromosomal replication initiator protein DnaA [Thermoleophilaceae bacterium]